MLWNSDKIKYKELAHYLILLSDDIFWQSKDQYLQIIENFTNRSIDGEEFVKQFGKLRRANLNASNMREANLEAEAIKSILLTVIY